jgi:hypothetical protein
MRFNVDAMPAAVIKNLRHGEANGIPRPNIDVETARLQLEQPGEQQIFEILRV